METKYCDLPLYICTPNRLAFTVSAFIDYWTEWKTHGNAAAKLERANEFAAKALAAYRGY